MGGGRELLNPILRKHLNADALFSSLHNDFSKISDFRQGNIEISMADALMSGFAMFSLEDPSLLAFDERRGVDQNLKDIYLIDDSVDLLQYQHYPNYSFGGSKIVNLRNKATI